MRPETLAALNAARADRRAAILVTDIADGEQRLVAAEAVEADPLAPLLARALASGRSALVEAEGRQLFLTVQVPPVRLVVIGAVHIAQALAPMATLAGFAVTIIDPRRAFAAAARFPEHTLCTDWPDEALERHHPDLLSAVITLSHDPKLDDPALIAALRSDAFYIGSLGSKRTHAQRLTRLREQGFDETALARIHAPVGLDLGGRMPAEIAVAILAEVLQVRYRGVA